jgi:hypothetical protein
LVQASDASGGVAAVANRWGIRHLGRFAGEYRKMFGELPSRTLANSLASGAERASSGRCDRFGREVL